jgi:hypothetical protein
LPPFSVRRNRSIAGPLSYEQCVVNKLNLEGVPKARCPNVTRSLLRIIILVEWITGSRLAIQSHSEDFAQYRVQLLAPLRFGGVSDGDIQQPVFDLTGADAVLQAAGIWNQEFIDLDARAWLYGEGFRVGLETNDIVSEQTVFVWPNESGKEVTVFRRQADGVKPAFREPNVIRSGPENIVGESQNGPVVGDDFDLALQLAYEVEGVFSAGAGVGDECKGRWQMESVGVD